MEKKHYLCNLIEFMDIILKYFPELTETQRTQFSQLAPLYADWNAKINVISRKDIDNIYEHHVLHSLAIAQVLRFKPDTTLLDVGSGGGFPGIPLAIMFPECQFTLLDSVGKKLKVASEIASAIGLKNVQVIHSRIEDVNDKYDFVLSRAAMDFQTLARLTKKNIAKSCHNALPNGIICLKGGELQKEIYPYRNIISLFEISDWFTEEYFKEKKAIYLPVSK